MEEDKIPSSDRDQKSTYSQLVDKRISSLLSEARLLCEGKAESAVAKMTRAIVLQPKNPELFRVRAEAYLKCSNYHAAIINFNRVVALNPSEYDVISERLGAAYHLHGLALMAENNHEEALEALENASDYNPQNKETSTKRVECLIALKRYTESLVLVEKELDEDESSNADMLIIRAQLNLLFGKTSHCYLDVCKALEIRDGHTEALEMKKELEKTAIQCKNEAVHHSLLGRGKEALNKMNIALESNPGVPEFHILRGTIYRKMGDFNAAVDDYLMAMEKCGYQQECNVYQNASKQLVLTYNDFAMECFKQKHFDNAVTLLNRAIKAEKKEKGLYLNRGDCFYRMSNLQFALSDYQQALELDPTNWDVYCRVAVVCGEMGVDLYSKGKISEAGDFFSSAIQHNPKVSWFYTCRARVRQELKDIDGCKEDILCSLTLSPKSDECLSLIAKVYPGKTKQDIINLTPKSTQVQSKLKDVMKKMSVKIIISEKESKDTSKKYISGIELKMESNSDEPCVSSYARSFPTTHMATKPSTSISTSGVTEEGDDLGSPHVWLTCSIPSLPDICTEPHEHRIMPVLQDCLQEANFHKSIYYSKKNCTEELEEFLRCPPDDYIIPRPPRIQNVQDLTVGGRTIVTAGTLRKSITNNNN